MIKTNRVEYKNALVGNYLEQSKNRYISVS